MRQLRWSGMLGALALVSLLAGGQKLQAQQADASASLALQVVPLEDARKLATASLRFRLAPGEESLGELMVRSLLLGTRNRSRAQIQEALFEAGCHQVVTHGDGLVGLDLSCLSPGLENGLGVLLDVGLAPSFSEAAFLGLREQFAAERQSLDDGALAQARAALEKALTGSAPTTAQQVASYGIAQVLDLHRRVAGSGSVSLAVVGVLDADKIQALAEGALQRLPASTPSAAGATRPAAAAPKTLAPIVRPIEGAWAVLGHGAPPPGDPDEAALSVVLDLLAGPGQSLLGKALSDAAPAWVAARLRQNAAGGLVILELGIAAGAYQPARKSISSVLERLAVEGPSTAELELAQRRVLGSFLRRQEGFLGEARARARTLLQPGSVDDADWPQKVSAVTSQDIRRVTAAYLPKDLLCAAVVPQSLSGPGRQATPRTEPRPVATPLQPAATPTPLPQQADLSYRPADRGLSAVAFRLQARVEVDTTPAVGEAQQQSSALRASFTLEPGIESVESTGLLVVTLGAAQLGVSLDGQSLEGADLGALAAEGVRVRLAPSGQLQSAEGAGWLPDNLDLTGVQQLVPVFLPVLPNRVVAVGESWSGACKLKWPGESREQYDQEVQTRFTLSGFEEAGGKLVAVIEAEPSYVHRIKRVLTQGGQIIYVAGTGRLKGSLRYRWLPEEHQLLSVRGRLELSNDLRVRPGAGGPNSEDRIQAKATIELQ